MILSNNPKTYIALARYNYGYGGIIYKKYINRWAEPSAVHIINLRSNLWKNSNIKLRRIYDLK